MLFRSVAFVTGGAAVLARRSFHLVSAMMEGVDALGTLRRGWTAVKSQMDVDLGGPLLADGPGVVPDRTSTSTGPRDQAHVDALMGRGPDNQPLRADADSNGAGEAAVRNPKLARLVGREVTPDNFDMLRIEFYEQGYHLSMDADGFVRIRRHDGRRSELPSLMYDVETGLIREGVKVPTEFLGRVDFVETLRNKRVGRKCFQTMLPIIWCLMRWFASIRCSTRLVAEATHLMT